MNPPQRAGYLPLFHNTPVPWTSSLYLPVPGRHRGRLRIPILNFAGFHEWTLARCGRWKGYCLLCFIYLTVCLGIYAAYQALFGEVPTLVFQSQDLRQIWHWEVASGHYPTRHPRMWPHSIFFPLNDFLLAPRELNVEQIQNPALPPVGPKRKYINVESSPPQVAYPPRPLPGSIADLDVLMNYCDMSQNMARRSCFVTERINSDVYHSTYATVSKSYELVRAWILTTVSKDQCLKNGSTSSSKKARSPPRAYHPSQALMWSSRR